MKGLHLTADLRGCDTAFPAMTDPAELRRLCVDAVARVGLTVVGELFHRFPDRPAGAAATAAFPGGRPADGPNAAAPAVEPSAADPGDAANGITGVILLAESHLAVHTWPELASATLDVYVCNLGADNSARALGLMDLLCAAFAPGRGQRRVYRRGVV